MRDAAANDYAALMEVTFLFLASGQHSPSNSLIKRRVRDFVHHDKKNLPTVNDVFGRADIWNYKAAQR